MKIKELITKLETIDGTPLENGMHFCPKCGARMESKVKQDED